MTGSRHVHTRDAFDKFSSSDIFAFVGMVASYAVAIIALVMWGVVKMVQIQQPGEDPTRDRRVRRRGVHVVGRRRTVAARDRPCFLANAASAASRSA